MRLIVCLRRFVYQEFYNVITAYQVVQPLRHARLQNRGLASVYQRHLILDEDRTVVQELHCNLIT